MQPQVPSESNITLALEWVVTGVELFGVAIILIAALAATANYLQAGFSGPGWDAAFASYRSSLGRGILLGLEFLVRQTLSVR